jgi:hypothetical protein
VTRENLEQRLRGISWPATSTELRARVMRAAPCHEQRISWIDRLWFSRSWRWSMAAAAVVIVLAGQWAAAWPEPLANATSSSVHTQALEQLVQQSGFPAAEAESLVRRTMDRGTALSPATAVIDLFPSEGALR